jgi:hypothetical protein
MTTMMKKILITCVLAAGACGGGSKNANTTTTNTDTTNTDTTDTTGATGEGTPCSQEIALSCPDGQVDGCLKSPPEGDTHTCVPN